MVISSSSSSRRSSSSSRGGGGGGGGNNTFLVRGNNIKTWVAMLASGPYVVNCGCKHYTL